MNSLIACDQSQESIRRMRSLNGTWQLAQTESFGEVPQKFDHTIAVPGLVDMAKPAFETEDNQNLIDKVYWYRRTFNIEGDGTDLIQLKINKAKYHTKVYVNGKYVGENIYSFTPSVFNVKKYLNSTDNKNELMVGVGSKNMLPDTVVKGNDFEKTKYIPGIYDDVKIIQTGYPFISNLQIAPNVKKSTIRVQAHLIFNQQEPVSGNIRYKIKELTSGKEVKTGTVQYTNQKTPDFTVNIPKGHLWSPEDPFLYTLELRTKADSKITRFGLRSFEFKENKPYGFLNQKPYYLRGTNVNIYRFFEDSARGSLPWNDDWVIKLIKSYKEMHWNSARFCIGFPPERWYEIADSLGFMIQDEYPIWWGRNPKKDNYTVKAKYLAGEYKAWMKERWNHPSVIMWDAQNESVTKETGKAIRQVRSLDLSNRSWNNGWAPPGIATDPVETHPYLFIRYRESKPSPEGPLKDLLSKKRRPGNGPSKHMPAQNGDDYHNPIIINEYGWLWLNRDGSTTTLTDKVYQAIADDSLSTSQRRELYARYLAALTEYWRAYRTSAGVHLFCGLGYSRPDKPRGQTSDHFVNVEKLKYDPYFIKYVKPAFAPVGLMIDYWDKKVDPDELTTIPVHIINDTYQKFVDDLHLEIRQKSKVIESKSLKIEVDSNGKAKYPFKIKMPEAEGNYTLVAFYESGKDNVFSERTFKIVKP